MGRYTNLGMFIQPVVLAHTLIIYLYPSRKFPHVGPLVHSMRFNIPSGGEFPLAPQLFDQILNTSWIYFELNNSGNFFGALRTEFHSFVLITIFPR